MLLAATPAGSSRDAVMRYVQRERFRVMDASPVTSWTDRFVRERGGASYLKVYLGHYRSVFRVDVIAYYIFDQSGRLKEIVIIKDADAV